MMITKSLTANQHGFNVRQLNKTMMGNSHFKVGSTYKTIVTKYSKINDLERLNNTKHQN